MPGTASVPVGTKLDRIRGVAFLGGPLMSADEAGRVGGGGGVAPVGASGLLLCGDAVCARDGGGGGATCLGASSPACGIGVKGVLNDIDQKLTFLFTQRFNSLS